MKNKAWLKHVIAAVVTLLLGAGYFYVMLPAINVRSIDLWKMIFFLAVVYAVIYFFAEILTLIHSQQAAQSRKKYKSTQVTVSTKSMKITFGCIAGAAVLLILVCFLSSSVIFNASKYQQMLKVTEGDFNKDIAEMPLSQIPVVDKDTAQRLASRKIGEVVELVSQFNLSHHNSQINYKGKPYRVLPLEYADIVKWLTNDNIPYYVTVDMATQTTDLVELPQGMQYSPSEYFDRDLMRHLRFNFPTKMFDNVTFEINDEGHPYWIASYYTYTIGIVGGKDISGAILCDAVTGELTNYAFNEIPQWIDTVFDDVMVVEQADNWGRYKSGFFNSIFEQKGVVVTTEGYNYIAVNDDVWLYTGITSVVADESNIGFILINMRTKEAKTYSINGAEEYSAMSSAEGAVQEKGYTATFPILVNVADVPTYFISLKDNAGLVKMYSFVSVANYQIVGISDTLSGAMDDYKRLLTANGITDPSVNAPSDGEEYTIKLDGVSSAVVNGNTVYYLKSGDKIFTASISVSPNLPFIKEGDTITVLAKANDDGVYVISKIK
jgi:hypothetical protein